MELQDERQQFGLQHAFIHAQQLQANVDLMQVIIERRHRKRAPSLRRDWTRQCLGMGSRLYYGYQHKLC